MSRRMLVFLIAGLALAAPPKQRELKPGFNLFSVEQDIQLGKEAKTQVEREMTLVRDPAITDYVRRIGQKLATQKQAGGFPYSFEVVQDDNINAFALPGGPTFVNTGLVVAAENEAQLAGVMAHEISHVALRHGTNQASKANLIQLPAMLASAVAGRGGSLLGQLTQVGIGLGAGSVLLKYSRNAERDADLLGTRIMAQAGYNPIEMARFFEKLEAQSGSRGLQFFSDHPNPGNRVKAVQDEILYLPQGRYDASAGSLADAQARIRALPKAPAKKAADAKPADLRPSGRLREYRGREFSLRYPDNWEVFESRDSQGLTIAPRQGLVQGSGGGNVAIGYGFMAGVYTPQSGRADLERGTEDLIRRWQSENQGMRVGGEGARPATVASSRALATTLYSASPFRGQNEIDWLITVERPRGIAYFVFIAPESEFRSAQPTFEEMLRSLRFGN